MNTPEPHSPRQSQGFLVAAFPKVLTEAFIKRLIRSDANVAGPKYSLVAQAKLIYAGFFRGKLGESEWSRRTSVSPRESFKTVYPPVQSCLFSPRCSQKAYAK